MSKTPENDQSVEDPIVDIEVDLPIDLQCQVIDAWALATLSPPSYSYLKRSLEARTDHPLSMDSILTELGRAVFNEILLDALKAEVSRVLNKEEPDDNQP